MKSAKRVGRLRTRPVRVRGNGARSDSSSLSEVPSEADSLQSLSSTGSTTGGGTQTRDSTNEWEQCYRAMDERGSWRQLDQGAVAAEG